MDLDQAILNKVWERWCGINVMMVPSDYSRVARRSSFAQRFEQWLYDQGVIVMRKNKKCFLHFSITKMLRHLC